MSDQDQHTPQQSEEEAEHASAPTYPWEGVAALILALGADRDEVPKVWEAMQYTTLPRDPMDAVAAFDHAIALVKSGKQAPGKPENFPETARDQKKIEEQILDEEV